MTVLLLAVRAHAAPDGSQGGGSSGIAGLMAQRTPEESMVKEIESLKRILDAAEAALSKGFSQAVQDTAPDIALQRFAKDLEMHSQLMKTPEKTALGQGIVLLQEKIEANKKSFKEKIRNSSTVKAGYTGLLTQVESLALKSNELKARYDNLGERVKTTAVRAGEFQTLYVEVRNFKGPEEAKAMLLKATGVDGTPEVAEGKARKAEGAATAPPLNAPSKPSAKPPPTLLSQPRSQPTRPPVPPPVVNNPPPVIAAETAAAETRARAALEAQKYALAERVAEITRQAEAARQDAETAQREAEAARKEAEAARNEAEAARKERAQNAPPAPAPPPNPRGLNDLRPCRITGLIPADSVNIRSGPGVDYPAVLKLQNGAIIFVVGPAVTNGDELWVPCVVDLIATGRRTGIAQTVRQRGWVNQFFLEEAPDFKLPPSDY